MKQLAMLLALLMLLAPIPTLAARDCKEPPGIPDDYEPLACDKEYVELRNGDYITIWDPKTRKKAEVPLNSGGMANFPVLKAAISAWYSGATPAPQGTWPLGFSRFVHIVEDYPDVEWPDGQIILDNIHHPPVGYQYSFFDIENIWSSTDGQSSKNEMGQSLVYDASSYTYNRKKMTGLNLSYITATALPILNANEVFDIELIYWPPYDGLFRTLYQGYFITPMYGIVDVAYDLCSKYVIKDGNRNFVYFISGESYEDAYETNYDVGFSHYEFNYNVDSIWGNLATESVVNSAVTNYGLGTSGQFTWLHFAGPEASLKRSEKTNVQIFTHWLRGETLNYDPNAWTGGMSYTQKLISQWTSHNELSDWVLNTHASCDPITNEDTDKILTDFARDSGFESAINEVAMVAGGNPNMYALIIRAETCSPGP